MYYLTITNGTDVRTETYPSLEAAYDTKADYEQRASDAGYTFDKKQRLWRKGIWTQRITINEEEPTEEELAHQWDSMVADREAEAAARFWGEEE